jgi:hypothetical protein
MVSIPEMLMGIDLPALVLPGTPSSTVGVEHILPDGTRLAYSTSLLD